MILLCKRLGLTYRKVKERIKNFEEISIASKDKGVDFRILPFLLYTQQIRSWWINVSVRLDDLESILQNVIDYRFILRILYERV